jgi:hypothetical protein
VVMVNLQSEDRNSGDTPALAGRCGNPRAG